MSMIYIQWMYVSCLYMVMCLSTAYILCGGYVSMVCIQCGGYVSMSIYSEAYSEGRCASMIYIQSNAHVSCAQKNIHCKIQPVM